MHAAFCVLCAGAQRPNERCWRALPLQLLPTAVNRAGVQAIIPTSRSFAEFNKNQKLMITTRNPRNKTKRPRDVLDQLTDIPTRATKLKNQTAATGGLRPPPELRLEARRRESEAVRPPPARRDGERQGQQPPRQRRRRRERLESEAGAVSE